MHSLEAVIRLTVVLNEIVRPGLGHVLSTDSCPIIMAGPSAPYLEIDTYYCSSLISTIGLALMVTDICIVCIWMACHLNAALSQGVLSKAQDLRA